MISTVIKIIATHEQHQPPGPVIFGGSQQSSRFSIIWMGWVACCLLFESACNKGAGVVCVREMYNERRLVQKLYVSHFVDDASPLPVV